MAKLTAQSALSPILGTDIAYFVSDPSGTPASKKGAVDTLFTSRTITTPTFSGAVTWPDNVRVTFNPGATVAGINVGAQAGDPSTPINGDLWYDSTGNLLRARINGATISLGTGGGGSGTLTATGISLPVNQLVLGNTYPDTKPLGSLGTTTTLLHGNAGGAPTFSGVAIADHTATGTPSSSTFLRGDNTWSTPAGAGTVTNTGGNLTANAVMLGAGTTDSKVMASLGTTTTLLHGNAAGAPTFAGVAIADHTATGTPSATTFLRGDNTWATPAGSGTVTATGGSLTANALVLGAGGTDTKVVAGIITDGVSNIIAGIRDKGGQVYNVKAYGAVGDGTTDDSTNIQTAITAAKTNGGVVYFPPGTYKIATTLNCDSNTLGFSLIGAGGGNHYSSTPSVLLYTGSTGGATGGLIRFNSAFGFEVAHLGFQYNNASFTGDLVNLDGNPSSADTQDFHIHHCSSKYAGAGNTARSIIRLNKAVIGQIDHCHLTGAANTIRVGDPGGSYVVSLAIEYSTFNFSTDAHILVGSADAESIQINYCTFEAGTNTTAIRGATTAGDGGDNQMYTPVIANNWCGDASGTTVWIKDLRTTSNAFVGTISGNRFAVPGTSSGTHLKLFGKWLVIGNSFEGNTVYDSGTPAAFDLTAISNLYNSVTVLFNATSFPNGTPSLYLSLRNLGATQGDASASTLGFSAVSADLDTTSAGRAFLIGARANAGFTTLVSGQGAVYSGVFPSTTEPMSVLQSPNHASGHVVLLAGTTPTTILDATATTVNFAGAATTLNIGASATCILNFGGSTTASEFRFLEPSGSGTNYSAFKAVAQSANITYSLPATVAAAGQFLKDVAGDGVLSWATPGGSGTVTATGGSLTANSVVLGAGTTDTKVVAGIITDGTAALQLGVVSSSTGSLKLAHASSANLTTITAGNAAAARTYVWPTNFGASGTVLTDAAGNGTLSWTAPSGSGTVTVVGAGSLTSTALVTGGGSQTIQTPSATATLDSSGNVGGIASLVSTLGSALRIGGLARTTDTTPAQYSIQAESAWSQGTTGPTIAGADLNLSGGLGRRYYQSVSNTAGVVTVTTTVDGTAVALTSGTDFTLGSDNTSPQLAVTATNLAAAINGNGTLSAKLTATASAALVYLDKLAATKYIAIATDQSARIAKVIGADGLINFTGRQFTFKTNYNGGTSYLAGTANIIVDDAGLNTAFGHGCFQQGTAFTPGTAARNTAFGYFAGELMSTGTDNSCFGRGSGEDIQTGSRNTCIGAQTAWLPWGGLSDNVLVGYQAGINLSASAGAGASQNVILGSSAGVNDANLNDSVLVGAGANMLVSSAIVDSIGLGRLTQITASNQFVVGASAHQVTDIYFGAGVTKTVTPTTPTLQATGGEGTNIVGSDFIVAGGKSTGNAVPGSLNFATATAGGSGTTLQTLTNRWKIDGTNNGYLTGIGAASVLVLPEISSPATPAANSVALYCKDFSGTSSLYLKRDNGAEIKIDSPPQLYIDDPGAFTIPATAYLDQRTQLTLTSVERIGIESTGRAAILDRDAPPFQGTYAPGSFALTQDDFLLQYKRLSLRGNQRADIRDSAEIILTTFQPVGRLELAGSGGI